MPALESTSAHLRNGEINTANESTAVRAATRLQGPIADLDLFVAELPNISVRELSSLIQVDLASRWNQADRKTSEDYFRRFPHVVADTEVALDIIYCEFLVSERTSGHANLDDFVQRFPDFGVLLTEQVRLHHALLALERSESPANDGDAKTNPARFADTPTSPEACYDIIEQIGSGGMGVVYRARQTTLNRDVALKMLRAIDADNRELLARFQSEARVVASLHHPQIVQVFDYGEHEGLPYLAMELMSGGSLADRLNGTPWSPHASAQLLVQLAAAVQYAHDQQVIHRDLKPANVLIAADEPQLAVKIADFGLAKCFIEDSPLRADSLAFLGTPSYMAPEQARGGSRNTGAATDIYSLGSILYELLTGRPPICGESPGETLRLLLSTEPVSVRQLAPQVPRDLATICDKCLQASSERRYASAAALRDDLERFLVGKPIQARPVSEIERAWRWCGRNPLLAGALSAVILLLVGITTVSVGYSTQLRSELARSRKLELSEREANRQAQLQLWDALLSKAESVSGSGRVGRRFDSLAAITTASDLQLDPAGKSERNLQLRNAVIAAVAQTDLQTTQTITNWQGTAHGGDLRVAADRCVSVSDEGTVSGFRLSDGRFLWTIPGEQQYVRTQLSSDGRLLALTDRSGIALWRIHSDHPEQAWRIPQARHLSFAPDGLHVAYSLDAGMFLARLSDATVVRPLGEGPALSRFEFDESSSRVAVCTESNVQIISLDTGEVETEFPPADVIDPILAWHPAGDYLAVWQSSTEACLWNSRTGAKAHTFPLAGAPGQLCFSGDGSILAAESLWTGRLWVWDVASGETCLDVPDIDFLASEPGEDDTIQFLAQADGAGTAIELSGGACREFARSLDAPLGGMMIASTSPDGRLIACSGSQGIELWDLQTRRRLAQCEIGYCSAFFNSAGDLIVGTQTGVYHLPRQIESPANPAGETSPAGTPSQKQSLLKFGPPRQLHEAIYPLSLYVNASAETMIFAETATWSLRQAQRDQVLPLQTTDDPRCGAVSNDNLFVAIANWENPGATVWDATTGAPMTTLDIGKNGVLRFSPDGRFLAATPDGVTLWNTRDWTLNHQLKLNGTTPTGLNIAFSPDSRVLAVLQSNGVIELVDTYSKQRLASLRGPQTIGANCLIFSPDQRWLIATTPELESQVWDLAALRRELASRVLDWPADILKPRQLGMPLPDRVSVSLECESLKPLQDSSPEK